MKYLFYFISLTFLVSCGSDLDVEFPATYTYSSLEIESRQAFRYTNGAFKEVDVAEVGEPNASGMSGDWDEINLIDNGNLIVTDDNEQYEEEYSVSEGKLSFRAYGSAYAMEIIDGGQGLSSLRVGGGPFNDLNPSAYVTVTCEDEGCDDLDANGYLYGNNEGEIQYVIIFKETYTKQ